MNVITIDISNSGNSARDSVLRELIKQSDRAMAILRAALVEEALSSLIRSRWRNADTDTIAKKCSENLFGPARPLGTFSAKHKVAYLSGIIGRNTRSDISSIRDIRNDFAHKLSLPTENSADGSLSFRDGSIMQRCANLRIANSARLKIAEYEYIINDSARNQYLLAVAAVSQAMRQCSEDSSKNSLEILH